MAGPLMRAYLDSCTIIYAIDGGACAACGGAEHLATVEGDPNGLLVTSRLSRLECRVKPLRDMDSHLLSLYDRFFSRPRLQVLEITAAVVDRATDLRVRYSFRTPDALHLATAIESSADFFLTGDADLRRCTEIPVTVL